MSNERPPTPPLWAVIYLLLGFGLSATIVALLGIELNFQHALPLMLTSVGTVFLSYFLMEAHYWLTKRRRRKRGEQEY